MGSDLDLDSDSDGLAGDNGLSRLHGTVDQSVDMVEPGQGLKGGAQASKVSSKDGWLDLAKFSGTSSEDAQLWWNSFDLFKNFKEINSQRALAIFPLMLKDDAMTWYLGQPAATKADWTQLQTAFKERYFPQEINR